MVSGAFFTLTNGPGAARREGKVMKGGGTMPPNVFDQANRYGVQPDPIGYFRWLIPGLDPALGFHGWLDTRTVPFPGEPDRTSDTVAHLAADVQSGPNRTRISQSFCSA